MSPGRLHLIGLLGVEVFPDGVVVYGCSHGDKQVPNGVGKRDDAVALEEDHPQAVEGPADQQLIQPSLLGLGGGQGRVLHRLYQLWGYVGTRMYIRATINRFQIKIAM